MNELIRITERNGKKAVSARELYEFLGYDLSNWKRWYNKNIIDNQFATENEDYIGFVIKTSSERNGNETQDFALSIRFAKKLSMMAKTEKGEQARDYFIACEEQVTTNQCSVPKLQDLTEAKIIAADYTIKTLNLNDASKLPLIKAINEPLGLPTPDYVESKGTLITISEIAKEVGLSSSKANQILASLGILEKKTRRSTKDKSKEKCFWSIVPEYAYLGENLVSPNNQSETQPKWYSEKKGEVLELLQKKIAA